MSLLVSENLLQQYNKEKAISARATDTAPQTRKFATSSYLNQYDPLFTKYSQDPNFNIDMLKTAYDLGEQDSYFALLEQNKGNTLSKNFYDPAYYNYESMMLELYKGTADNTKKTQRTQEVFDSASGQWIEQDLGEMTDQQYIQYQLDKSYAARAEELQLQLETWRKDQMSVAEKVGHTLVAGTFEFGEGVLSAAAGLVDFLVAMSGPLPGFNVWAANGFEGNYLDAFVNYFAEQGLTAAEQRTIRASLDEYERLNTYVRDIDGSYTGFGQYWAGISNSIGMMVPAMITGGIAGAASLPAWLGQTVFYSSVFSRNLYENATNPETADSPAWTKIANAGVRAGAEMLIEYALNAALGSTVSNQMIGMRGGVTNVATKLTTKGGLAYAVKSAAQEGLEEFLQDFGTECVNQFTALIDEGYGKTGVTAQTLIDSFFMGVLSSFVMTGGAMAADPAMTKVRNVRGSRKSGGEIKDAGETYIVNKNEDGTVTKERLRGFRKLQFKSIISDFQASVEKLSKNKMSASKNIALAQEVYGAFSAISQYYAGFDQKRIEQCEMLLSRVIEAESEAYVDTATENLGVSASQALSPETLKTIEDKSFQKKASEKSKKAVTPHAKLLSLSIGASFVEMQKYVSAMPADEKRVKKAAEAVSETLDKNNVTDIVSVTNKDGDTVETGKKKDRKKKDRKKKDPIVEAAEKTINKKEKTLDELRKDYDWVFTVDGNIAIDEDNILFVSESWLENYTTSEIYEFLVQQKVLSGIIRTEKYTPFVNELIDFNKEFTGRKDVDAERAIMDFLFNSTIYQGFLLKSSGERMHKHMDFVFNFHGLVEIISKAIIKNDKRLSENTRALRRLKLDKIIEQIKEVRREPTIKAILNWGLVAQEVGADTVLTPDDKRFVAEELGRRRVLMDMGKSPSLAGAYANSERKIRDEGRFSDEELAFLDRVASGNCNEYEKLEARLMLDHADEKAFRGNPEDVFFSSPSFIVPHEAAVGLMNEPHRMQYVADVLTRFEQIYGVSAEELMNGRLNKMSFSQTEKLSHELTRGDYPRFVQTRLEGMLGDNYIVLVKKNDANEYQFSIAEKIPASKFLPESFLQTSRLERDELFLSFFQKPSETLGIMSLMYQGVLKMIDEGDPDLERKVYPAIKEGKEPVSNLVFIDFFGDKLWIQDELFEFYKIPFNYLNQNTKEFSSSEEMLEHWLEDMREILNRKKRLSSVKLSSLINTENFEPQLRALFDEIDVILTTGAPYRGVSYSDYMQIEINYDESDYFMTLIHEVNHVLQDYYGLPNGGGFLRNRKLLTYIANNFPHLVSYMAKTEGSGTYSPAQLKILTESEISPSLASTLAYAAYNLLGGEILARTSEHNEIVRGFTINGDKVISPDGKVEFDISEEDASEKRVSASMSNATTLTEPVATSALETSVIKLINDRYNGYEESTTYHSSLTKSDAKTLLEEVLSPTLNQFFAMTVRLDDVVKNPQMYLSEEFLSTLNGDLSEGNVFFRLKSYYEKNNPGISIDRSGKHKYVFVDDNSYTDLLTREKQKEIGDERTFYDKYNGEKIPLSEFYSKTQLELLGVPSDSYVLIDPAVKTETITGGGVPIIHIRADYTTTNREIIHKLNHEFRHMMQYLHNFETGFTASFEVSKELLQDVKEHMPFAFRDEQVRKIAKDKAKYTGDTVDNEIAKVLIYYLTGGEIMAHGFDTSTINFKVGYVDIEAGKATIYLPWYDGKNEGRHQVKSLANRSDDINQEVKKPKKPKKSDSKNDEDGEDDAPVVHKVRLPRPSKKKGIAFTNLPKVDIEEKKKAKKADKRSRYVSYAEAQRSNLKYFAERAKKEGKRVQLDPDLQDFVVLTTGYESELPPEIMSFITQGRLTKDLLFQWFRETDNINQFTFDAINSIFFKNPYLRSLKDVDDMLQIDPAIWWATSLVLMERGKSIEPLVKENDLDTFKEFINLSEQSDLKEYIYEVARNFAFVRVKDEGKNKWADITDEMLRYMRVFAMEYWNGTLSGAFYTANQFRNYLAYYQHEQDLSVTSTNRKYDNGKGDKEVDFEDNLTGDNAIQSSESLNRVGNSIIGAYEKNQEVSVPTMRSSLTQHHYNSLVERTLSNIENDDFRSYTQEVLDEITEISIAERKRQIKEKGNLTAEDKRRLNYLGKIEVLYAALLERTEKFSEKLENLDEAEISVRYQRIREHEFIGKQIDSRLFETDNKLAHDERNDATEDSDGEKLTYTRAAIQGRIKVIERFITPLLDSGEIKLTDLPEEVRDFFEKVEFTSEDKRKTFAWRLKGDVYKVGRGKVSIDSLSTKTREEIQKDFKFLKYDRKQTLEKEYDQTHDITRIKENEKLLRIARTAVKDLLKARKTQARAAEEDVARHIKNLEKEIKKAAKDKTKIIVEAREKGYKTTDFTVVRKKKAQINDTPSNFTIISGVDMPDVVRTLFDVSFSELANTKVQFLSRDEEGNLYDKENEKMSGKEFESRLKHEVSSWDAFYEAVRPILLELTRQDVEEIVDFFEHGAVTLDGPANKLEAIKVFTLTYIVDCARRNVNSWNFSQSEVEHIEKICAMNASRLGSGLNAVAQMIAVIEPYKRVRQHMLDDYGLTAEQLDPLFNELDAIQKSTTKEAQTAHAASAAKLLKTLEEQMVRVKEPSWKKRWYGYFKSYRYTAMLSSPTTWIRNSLSNYVVTGLNSAADTIAKGVYSKRGYRDDQWDLTGTVVSNDVKKFIDEYILNNDLFESSYDTMTKYDQYDKKRAKKGLFVDLITKSLEQQYAANHRFPNGTLNWISKFVSRRISDKKFVKFATRKYLGKILTIEAAKGKVDLSKGLSNEALELFAEAVILANNDYMHKMSALGDLIHMAKQEHENLYEVLTFFFPFINSGFNWFVEGLKYSPFGLLNALHRMHNLEAQIAKVEQARKDGKIIPSNRAVEYLIRKDVGKGIIGVILMTLGLLLGLLGILSVEDDDDKFYMVAGDFKIDISNIFGTSTVLVFASIAQFWAKNDDGARENDLSRILDIFLTQLSEGFFARDILDRHEYDQGVLEWMLTETDGILRSFVPQAFQVAAALTNNKKIKYSSGFRGVWERWLNSWLPLQPAGTRRVDPYTGEIQSKYALPILGEFMARGFFGPKMFWSEISEEERLARELGLNKNELTGKLTVNDTEYSLDRIQLNEKYGQLNQRSLQKIKSQKHRVEVSDGKYSTMSWDRMTAEQRKDLVDKEMTKNAQYAKIWYWTQVLGNKYYASDTQWTELRKLGITQSVYKGGKGFVE